MKKIKFLLASLFFVITAQSTHASVLGIKVSVSSKAYWNGTGCTPRDKGGCVHVEGSGGLNVFTLNNSGGHLTLQASSEILRDPNYMNLFTKNTFYIGGISFDKDVLADVKYSGATTFPDKQYTYFIQDGVVSIQLN